MNLLLNYWQHGNTFLTNLLMHFWMLLGNWSISHFYLPKKRTNTSSTIINRHNGDDHGKNCTIDIISGHFFLKIYNIVPFCGEYRNAKRGKKKKYLLGLVEKLFACILNAQLCQTLFFIELSIKLQNKSIHEWYDGLLHLQSFWSAFNQPFIESCTITCFFVSPNFISTLNLICISPWIYDEKH